MMRLETRRLRWLVLVAGLAAGIAWLLAPETGHGYPVPPLPVDNLIVNPWFRSAANPTVPGFDGWVRLVNEDGSGWGLSQKESNPSPDILVSGGCGHQEVYCGTGIRWANETIDKETLTFPGADVYIYQVVAATPADRRLKYAMYWVNHKLEVGEVTIFAGDSADGPWTTVWTPFILTQNINPPPQSAPGRNGVPWFQTAVLDTVLGDGAPFYKIELHARYGEAGENQGDVGMKVTGIYFATEATEGPASLSTPVLVHNPTVEGAAPVAAGRGQRGTPAAEATTAPGVAETPTTAPGDATAAPSASPTARLRPVHATGTAVAATATAVAALATPTATATERARPTFTSTATRPPRTATPPATAIAQGAPTEALPAPTPAPTDAAPATINVTMLALSFVVGLAVAAAAGLGIWLARRRRPAE